MSEIICPDCHTNLHAVYDVLDDSTYYQCQKCKGKYIPTSVKIEVRLLHPKDCIVEHFSSRVCEKGTKCCTVHHKEEYEKKIKDTHKNSLDHFCKDCGMVWYNCLCSHDED